MNTKSSDARGLKHQLLKNLALVAAGIGIAGVAIGTLGPGRKTEPHMPKLHQVGYRGNGEQEKPNVEGLIGASGSAAAIKPRRSPEFINNGIAWLIKAQHPDGGWGAGSNANQQLKDPHAVQVDPATTAFVVSALLRSGHTPVAGEYKEAARRATAYLCGAVEEYTKPGPKITDLSGTQIQAKLGPLVDTAMTAQYMARVLPLLPKEDPLHARVDKALDKCLAKLHESQQKDGSWNVGGGWASVLQSSLGCSAMEYAQAAGKPVDKAKLQQARTYQLSNFDAKTGKTNTAASAGVALYSYNSSMRGNAAQSRAAVDLVEEGKKSGKLAADAPITEENLRKAGAKFEEAQQLFVANSNVTSQVGVLNGLNTYAGTSSASLGRIADADVVDSAPSMPITRGTSAPTEAVAATTTITAGTLATYPDGSRSSAALTLAKPTFKGAAAAKATDDEALLAGFGNNGGEEFLSYMLASESMVIMGEKDWAPWYDRMSGRLSKIQNPDGSWSGHHCITSPVFCTAAVVQTMTADKDAEMLARLAKEATAIAKVDAVKADTKKE